MEYVKQKETSNQANRETMQNVPHGSAEGVPTRTGQGKSDELRHTITQDDNTDLRRTRYGEDPRNSIVINNDQIADTDVNDVKTKRNKNMVEQIRLNNSGEMPETSYGRTFGY